MDDNIKSLLAPVDFDSFSSNASHRERSTYSGIPSMENPKMWDFSITENGDGTRSLSFLVNNRTLNFKLDEPEKPGEPIKAKRLSDTESDDFGVGGDSFKGRAQIHKSSPSKILGTFQTGKTNMTFELNSQKDNNSWVISPRKHPVTTVKSFVDTVLERKLNPKTAASFLDTATNIKDSIKKYVGNLTIDKLTYPLTGGIGALPSAALIGAGVMGARNIGQRLIGKEHNSLLKDLALGGLGGAAASGAFQLIGSPGSPLQSDNARKIMTENMDFKNPLQIPEKLNTDPNYLDLIKKEYYERKLAYVNDLQKNAVIKKEKGKYKLYTKDGKKILGTHETRQQAIKQEYAIQKSQEKQKLAFGTGNQQVDLIALQSILGADPTLTQGDRNILISQARSAMRASGGQAISIDRVKNMGLGMLAGYIISKAMGFGGLGTIASVAIGGFTGYGNRQSVNAAGPRYNSAGYYTY
jgi:hypothetical protein